MWNLSVQNLTGLYMQTDIKPVFKKVASSINFQLISKALLVKENLNETKSSLTTTTNKL